MSFTAMGKHRFRTTMILNSFQKWNWLSCFRRHNWKVKYVMGRRSANNCVGIIYSRDSITFFSISKLHIRNLNSSRNEKYQNQIYTIIGSSYEQRISVHDSIRSVANVGPFYLCLITTNKGCSARRRKLWDTRFSESDPDTNQNFELEPEFEFARSSLVNRVIC
jgi:hypothetical protein